MFLCIQFDCCGFLGPQEFVDTTDPIDDSCYYTVKSQEDVSVVQMKTLNRVCIRFIIYLNLKHFDFFIVFLATFLNVSNQM